MANGRLVTRQSVEPFAANGDGPVTLAVVEHACVFHADGHGGCAIQHALGHGALPLACRQFPRVTIRDPRGTSVTLSHYCPTAASMLGSDCPVSIELHPTGFPSDGEYVGLDADAALPPRLRPDMLMDWESWWLWERLAVTALAESRDADEGLGRLHAALEHVRSWRPSGAALTSRIEEAFRARPLVYALTPAERRHRVGEVLGAIPAALRPNGTPVQAKPAPSAAVHRDFLIAHAFANWTAHLGPGLRTWLRSLEAADALLASGFSISAADLWLRHLADPWALAEVWGEAEKG
jgi:hypothetical protein